MCRRGEPGVAVRADNPNVQTSRRCYRHPAATRGQFIGSPGFNSIRRTSFRFFLTSGTGIQTIRCFHKASFSFRHLCALFFFSAYSGILKYTLSHTRVTFTPAAFRFHRLIIFCKSFGGRLWAVFVCI